MRMAEFLEMHGIPPVAIHAILAHWPCVRLCWRLEIHEKKQMTATIDHALPSSGEALQEFECERTRKMLSLPRRRNT
jgi:hypothetical protein